jgi:hypothetical protein
MKDLVMNIESVKRSAEAEHLIKWKQPDRVGFLQASRARPWLILMAAKHGYYRHHLKGSQEKSNICLFLKKDKDLDVQSIDPMYMDEDWIGAKAGKHHEPRVYWKVVARKGIDPFCRSVFLHLPTDNADRAQAESVNRLVAYRNRHIDMDCGFMGDFNKEVEEMRPVVRRLRGELHTVGKVDHGVFSDATKDKDRDDKGHPTRLLAHHESLRKFMQDGAHGWGMYTWGPARIKA